MDDLRCPYTLEDLLVIVVEGLCENLLYADLLQMQANKDAARDSWPGGDNYCLLARKATLTLDLRNTSVSPC